MLLISGHGEFETGLLDNKSIIKCFVLYYHFMFLLVICITAQLIKIYSGTTHKSSNKIYVSNFCCLLLKCYYDEIFDIHFFYIFVHNRSFLDILPNFNPLRKLELAVSRPLLGSLRYENANALKYATVEESLGREHGLRCGKNKLRFVASDAMSFSSSLIWLLPGKLENCCV